MVDRFMPTTYRMGGGLPEKKGRARAPCCGLFVPAFRLANVSAIPDSVTGGVLYACDGCRGSWISRGKPMGEGKTASEFEFARIWGAPPAILQNLKQVNDSRLAKNPRLKARHDDHKAIYASRIEH